MIIWSSYQSINKSSVSGNGISSRFQWTYRWNGKISNDRHGAINTMINEKVSSTRIKNGSKHVWITESIETSILFEHPDVFDIDTKRHQTVSCLMQFFQAMIQSTDQLFDQRMNSSNRHSIILFIQSMNCELIAFMLIAGGSFYISNYGIQIDQFTSQHIKYHVCFICQSVLCWCYITYQFIAIKSCCCSQAIECDVQRQLLYHIQSMNQCWMIRSHQHHIIYHSTLLYHRITTHLPIVV